MNISNYSGSYYIPRFLNSNLNLTFFIGIVYFILAIISRFVLITEIDQIPFFPAAGFGIAMVYIFSKRAVAGIGMGSLIYGLVIFFIKDFEEMESFESLIQILFVFSRFIFAVLCALLTDFLIQKIVITRDPFTSGIQVLKFVFISVIVIFFVVTFGLLPLFFFDSVSTNHFLMLWSYWFSSHMLGTIVFTPFVLSWAYKINAKKEMSSRRFIELFLFIIITVLATVIIFITKIRNQDIIIFVFLWAVFRFGMRGVTFVGLIFTLIGVYFTSHGQGSFATDSVGFDFFGLQFYLFVNFSSALIMLAILKEKEAKAERFRSIFNNSQDVYFYSTLDGILLEISPAVEKYTQYKRTELLGNNVSELYYDLADREKIINELKTKGYLNDFEVRYLDKDGRIIYFSLNSQFVYDKNKVPVNIEGSMRDISERKKNELEIKLANERIKESEEKFRSIYENFEDVYFLTDMNGILLEISPSFEKHFKKSREEAIGNSVYKLYYDPEDRGLIREKLEKYGGIKDLDFRFTDAEGKIIYFSINARFIYDEEGNPKNIEGSWRNINERVLSSAEITQKNIMLENKNQELEQFTYIASHDLQEPMMTLLHCTHQLKQDLDGKVDDIDLQYIDFIEQSSTRMQQLVKGLMEYSRIGKEGELTEVDFNQLMPEVISDLKPLIDETKAEITYDDLPVVYASLLEMKLLLQNLIGNSIKFRKKNQQLKVHISAICEDNNWLFTVEDNGIGIDEKDKDKVFEIFKRLNNREEYQGTGIGLSNCKKIIDSHGGKIWVESKLNQGSKFKYTIPIVEV